MLQEKKQRKSNILMLLIVYYLLSNELKTTHSYIMRNIVNTKATYDYSL